jgi:hypothetical protein
LKCRSKSQYFWALADSGWVILFWYFNSFRHPYNELAGNITHCKVESGATQCINKTICHTHTQTKLQYILPIKGTSTPLWVTAIDEVYLLA